MSSPGGGAGGAGGLGSGANIAGGVSSIGAGIGGLIEAGGLASAAALAEQNAALTELSTNIQITANRRQAYQVMGSADAQTAASGFSLTGSALDILASSMQQSSLQNSLIGTQGLVEQKGWEQKAAADSAQSAASAVTGIGDIIGGFLDF